MSLNRRNFISLLGAMTGVAVITNFPKIAIANAPGKLSAQSPNASDQSPFELPPLPYAYDALEPYIDAETMKFHHDKHHASYTTKLNQAVSNYPELASQSAEDILRNLDQVPAEILSTVRNNGGGYVNHKMFWEIMSPDGGGEPTGAIAEAISKTFGSFDAFKEKFNAAGSAQFGSGWAWLVLDQNKQLKVLGTANQDSPLMEGMYPIMGNDVWEHAYYLTYRNERDRYLTEWWNVVNWEEINKRYKNVIA